MLREGGCRAGATSAFLVVHPCVSPPAGKTQIKRSEEHGKGTLRPGPNLRHAERPRGAALPAVAFAPLQQPGRPPGRCWPLLPFQRGFYAV